MCAWKACHKIIDVAIPIHDKYRAVALSITYISRLSIYDVRTAHIMLTNVKKKFFFKLRNFFILRINIHKKLKRNHINDDLMLIQKTLPYLII